jgi:hypothetical protein
MVFFAMKLPYLIPLRIENLFANMWEVDKGAISDDNISQGGIS